MLLLVTLLASLAMGADDVAPATSSGDAARAGDNPFLRGLAVKPISPLGVSRATLSNPLLRDEIFTVGRLTPEQRARLLVVPRAEVACPILTVTPPIRDPRIVKHAPSVPEGTVRNELAPCLR